MRDEDLSDFGESMPYVGSRGDEQDDGEVYGPYEGPDYDPYGTDDPTLLQPWQERNAKRVEQRRVWPMQRRWGAFVHRYAAPTTGFGREPDWDRAEVRRAFDPIYQEFMDEPMDDTEFNEEALRDRDEDNERQQARRAILLRASPSLPEAVVDHLILPMARENLLKKRYSRTWYRVLKHCEDNPNGFLSVARNRLEMVLVDTRAQKHGLSSIRRQYGEIVAKAYDAWNSGGRRNSGSAKDRFSMATANNLAAEIAAKMQHSDPYVFNNNVLPSYRMRQDEARFRIRELLHPEDVHERVEEAKKNHAEFNRRLKERRKRERKERETARREAKKREAALAGAAGPAHPARTRRKPPARRRANEDPSAPRRSARLAKKKR